MSDPIRERVDDNLRHLQAAVERKGTMSMEPVAKKRVRLPTIGDELFEHYPSMSAQTHEAAVKDYARKALSDAEERIRELQRERYELAYAITGGEDAPGLLDSVPVEQLVEIARDNASSHSADIDRATTAEAEAERLRALVEEAERVLEPFSIMAGELFARNFVDNEKVIVMQAADRSHIKVTFRDFRAARSLRDRLGVEG